MTNGVSPTIKSSKVAAGMERAPLGDDLDVSRDRNLRSARSSGHRKRGSATPHGSMGLASPGLGGREPGDELLTSPRGPDLGPQQGMMSSQSSQSSGWSSVRGIIKSRQMGKIFQSTKALEEDEEYVPYRLFHERLDKTKEGEDRSAQDDASLNVLRVKKYTNNQV